MLAHARRVSLPSMTNFWQTHHRFKASLKAQVEACKESPDENSSRGSPAKSAIEETLPVPRLDKSESEMSKSTNYDAELQAVSTQAQNEFVCKLACAAEVSAAAQHASEDTQVAMDQGTRLEQPAHTERPDCREEAGSAQADADTVCELACAAEIALAQHSSEHGQVGMDEEANLEQPAQEEMTDCQGEALSMQAQNESVCELECVGRVSPLAEHGSEDVQVTMDQKAKLGQPAQAELNDCQGDASSIQAQKESISELARAGGVSAAGQHASESEQVEIGPVEGIRKAALEDEEEEVIEMPGTAGEETHGLQSSCHGECALSMQDVSTSTPVASTVQGEVVHALPPTLAPTPGHDSSKTGGTSVVQSNLPQTAVPSWASEAERGLLSSRPIFLDRTYARLLEKQAAKSRGEDLPASWTPSRKTTSGAASPAPPLASPSPARSFATTSSPLASKTFAMTLSPVRKSPAMASHEKLTFSLGAASPVATRLQAVEDGKQRMLKELTEQMQVCLRKMSARDLDSRTREKYQAMPNSIKSQMDKLNGLPKTAQSPARALWSSLGASPSPLHLRGGGC
eukprot:TRINITY_DN5830_c0_g1_i4.p1 TRINITY_DN5830_c0_g1~~TRINITY_DN5830_c0_g1_i4.p1  ORF type:complete len:572 (-),score=124.26 TRINITY_DN5830_c0_g1_i4:50-1765(-)